MKNLIKKTLSILLAMVTCFSMAMTSFAQTTHNSVPEIVFAEGLKKGDIPDNVIEDIFESYPDAETITILEYSKKIPLNTNRNFSKSSNIRDVVRTTTATDVIGRNEFIISVAKGSTTTLRSNWKQSLEATVSGGADIFDLGLTAEIAHECEVTRVFNGPPESSYANTRIYYAKFLEDRGTYVAKQYSGLAGSAGMMWREINGNWTEPTDVIEYSVDYRI